VFCGTSDLSAHLGSLEFGLQLESHELLFCALVSSMAEVSTDTTPCHRTQSGAQNCALWAPCQGSRHGTRKTTPKCTGK